MKACTDFILVMDGLVTLWTLRHDPVCYTFPYLQRKFRLAWRDMCSRGLCGIYLADLLLVWLDLELQQDFFLNTEQSIIRNPATSNKTDEQQ